MKKKSSIGGRRPLSLFWSANPSRRRDLTTAGDPDWPTESPRLTLIDIFPVLDGTELTHSSFGHVAMNATLFRTSSPVRA
jgi:hypothetical protein